MDKKRGKCRICDVFISTVLSRRPKVSSLRLISINFVRFFVLPSFFTKVLTVKGARPWKETAQRELICQTGLALLETGLVART